MKNTSILCISAAFLIASTSTAQGTEVHLTVGNQGFSDPAYGLVSYTSSASMLGVRGSKAASFGNNIALVVGFESGSTHEGAYDYSGDSYGTGVTTSLRMHAFEFGLRADRPLGQHLRPYAAIGARAVGGILTVADDISNWSVSDPSDPTGEGTLYEMSPERDVGLSLGVNASLGLAFRFNEGSQTLQTEEVSTTTETETSSSEETSIRPQRKWDWGLYAEGGYTLQTALNFTTSGALGLGGPRFLVGAFVDF